MKRFYILAITLVLAFVMSACIKSSGEPAETKTTEKKAAAPVTVKYNKYNIHTQYKSKDNITAHFANWTGPFTGHRVVPPNTPIVVKDWYRGFIFERQDTGDQIKFSYSERQMDMDKETYINKLFSSKRVALKGLSSLDRKGVKKGVVLKGMSKKGVMTALGYPAAHKTPSLKENVWMYWKNRFGKRAVTFNSKGKVIKIKN